MGKQGKKIIHKISTLIYIIYVSDIHSWSSVIESKSTTFTHGLSQEKLT